MSPPTFQGQDRNNFERTLKTWQNAVQKLGPVSVKEVLEESQKVGLAVEGGQGGLRWGESEEWIYDSKYTGTVDASGQPHGIGRAISNYGGLIYEGQFKNGQFHGYTREYYSDGYYYLDIYNEHSLVSGK